MSTPPGEQQLAVRLADMEGCPALFITTPPPYGGYDPVKEEAEYSRSLLPPDALAQVKTETFLSAVDIRRVLEQNTNSRLTPEGVFVLDADLIFDIDIRTNQPMFILPDNTVHTREELIETYPFDLFKTTPEEIFAQQELGVFPVRTTSLDTSGKEYLVRDLGKGDGDFIMFEDLIGRYARENYEDRRPIEKTVKTKVFLARDGWEDFLFTTKQVRATRRVLGRALQRSEGQGGALLALMFGTSATKAPLSLESSKQVEERQQKQAAELAAREEKLRQQEAALDARIEKLSQLISDLP
jgi:hypothetical protein